MARVAIGRRAFLALSASSLLRAQNGKGASFVFPPQQFLDPATEFDLFRLTDPAFQAWLPAANLRFLSRRSRFLIHASDRAGNPQIYRLDWHNGESRQLTSATALDPQTPGLSPDDRNLFYFDGPALKTVPLANLHEREITRVAGGWERAPGFALSSDAMQAVWVEKRSERYRLRTLRMPRGEPATVLESPGLVGDPEIRPGGSQMAYRSGTSLRLMNLDGTGDRAIPLEPNRTHGQALWNPDGSTLLYLAVPNERRELVTLREYTVADQSDKLVAKTSQFGSFGINRDASVFVGASRSLASPYILLLLRSVRRELTLCEHRSSDPSAVQPVFSPDSQSIFFTSDRRGKRCIYRAHVEKFVEETAEEPGETR